MHGALQGVDGTRQSAMNVQLSLEETYADVVPLRPEGASSAFLSIMRGCNNMCAFCIVPFTRGRERSRPTASIIDEVRLPACKGSACAACWADIHPDLLLAGTVIWLAHTRSRRAQRQKLYSDFS